MSSDAVNCLSTILYKSLTIPKIEGILYENGLVFRKILAFLTAKAILKETTIPKVNDIRGDMEFFHCVFLMFEVFVQRLCRFRPQNVREISSWAVTET